LSETKKHLIVIFTPHFAPNASLRKQGMGAAGLNPVLKAPVITGQNNLILNFG
jgi:hypothetical protein